MTKRKAALIVSTVTLILMGIAIPAIFHPFLEGASDWLRLLWLGVFIATFVLMLLNVRSWYALLALLSLVFTAALWISV